MYCILPLFVSHCTVLTHFTPLWVCVCVCACYVAYSVCVNVFPHAVQTKARWHSHLHTHTRIMKEVQLEHPTPINQLSKQIHIRPSIVAALENSHLGKQHKSSNCIPPLVHIRLCARGCVRIIACVWHTIWAITRLVVMGRLSTHQVLQRVRGQQWSQQSPVGQHVQFI